MSSVNRSGEPGPSKNEKERSRSSKLPRIVCYHQTHYHNGEFVSILPLLETEATHVIIAAIHLHSHETVRLNDDAFDDPKNVPLWDEVRTLQHAGVTVLGMLGGAHPGSFSRLDGDDTARFEEQYAPLRRMIERTALDGLDLDVEEPMSLAGIVRLIERLKRDFGPDFLITLAPVAAAMMAQEHLSGFDYEILEMTLSADIAWYNTQFYCGWGSMENAGHYEMIIAQGWPVDKIVVGLVTNPGNGAGWLPDQRLRETLAALTGRYLDFGGVMGWEYFNSMTELDGHGKPLSWAHFMSSILRPSDSLPRSLGGLARERH